MADPPASDPLLKNARRDVRLVLIVNTLALLWTVGYSYLFGYQHDADAWVVQWGLVQPRTLVDLQLIAGLPDWIFVGVLLPWLLCTAFTIGVCLSFKDDDLGEDVEDTSHGH